MSHSPALTTAFDELRVVTSARWLAPELAAAGLIPVVGDLGLDLPANTDWTAWWCSGGFAARMAASGRPAPLLGPPARWQAEIPEHFLGRDVTASTLAGVSALAGRQRWADGVFAKVADIKVAAVPAQWWPSLGRFLLAAAAAGLAGDTPVLVTGTRVEFLEEHRCFIADGHVVGASIYLSGQRTWDAWETGTQPPSGHAVGFAEMVLADLGRNQPPGWVLDVGLTSKHRWTVIEANPAWCANPYHTTPDGVIRSVLASQDLAGTQRAWAWEPGSYMRSHARPLPVRTAVHDGV